MKWLALALVLASGCAAHGRLYPVEGPYSKLTPPAVIPITLTGMRFSGDVEFTLPDGPTCKGEWASAAGSSVGLGTAGTAMVAMSSAQGQSPGRAVASCSDGRRVDLEFTITNVGTKSGVGTGKDTQGNVYRFLL